MDAIIGLGMLGLLAYGTVKIIKWVWTQDFAKTIIKNVCISLVTGGLVMAITGDPSFGVGGGITLALINIAVGGGDV